MTDEITFKDVQRYAPADNDILVLTTPAGLSGQQLDILDIQLKQLSALMLREHGKNVSTLVLPGGFDVRVLSKRASEGLGDAYTVEIAAAEFAKEWQYESSSAQVAAHAAFIAGHAFKLQRPVGPEKKTGLRFGDYLSHALYEQGKAIRRASWPVGDHLSADGAEGGTLWYYDASGDDLQKDWSLDFHDLGCDDWEITD